MAITLSSTPAHASSWLLTYSATGTETTTPFDPAPASGQTFSDSATGTNTVGSTKNWTSGFGFPGGATTSMTITVTVKGTWMGSDPVPPSVMVIETVHLDQDGANEDGSLATGTFDDSFGDQPVVVWRNNGTFDQTCNTPAGIPIAHQTIKSGSTFTLTDTFKVGSSATAHGSGSCSAAAHFNGYSATIHAQPYNFRSSGYDLNGTHYNKSVQDNPNATLALSYIWSSTDGDNTHLTTCTIKENVTWDSNPNGVGQSGTNPDGKNYYAPPSPPVGKNAQGQGLAYPNPTITQQPATRPGITDTFSPDVSYIGPYTAIS